MFATRWLETDPSFALRTPPHRHPPNLDRAHGEVWAWVEPVGAALAPGTVQGVATWCGQSRGGRGPTAGPKHTNLQVGQPTWKGVPRSTSGWAEGTAVGADLSALRTNSGSELWMELNGDYQGSKKHLSTWSEEGSKRPPCRHAGRATGEGALGPCNRQLPPSPLKDDRGS